MYSAMINGFQALARRQAAGQTIEAACQRRSADSMGSQCLGTFSQTPDRVETGPGDVNGL
jgi:hypothetical protein